MKKRFIGKNKLEVSAIGLGCMTIMGERYDHNSENGQSVRK